MAAGKIEWRCLICADPLCFCIRGIMESLYRGISAYNEAKDLKGLQKAAGYFLKNCYAVEIGYDNR